ncbi:uncharacterized protein LOC103710667 [Phoenix dactylifera]|uniref:Uncharacterized protein LOC103710667 n=1 Tax=Phoenix dactylifera TaxID=42345 RepID=A0A8B7C9R8_PHODC|nr:uncharacterized protein LOC103710667 [Phoenix dactylifera]
MASQSLNVYSPLTRQVKGDTVPVFSKAPVTSDRRHKHGRIVLSRGSVICCSAVQESSAAAVTDKKEAEPAAKAAAPAVKKAPEKPKKPPAKPLPQLMEEDLIPSLKATLEAQEDVSQIEISFRDNRLEGSFLKEDVPYIFWAFFPNGDLTGPKAFSLSSYGYEASTVEPFLIDERRVTAQLVVFWIRKRLAAQGILPVWKE